jgi:hypothetical protein
MTYSQARPTERNARENNKGEIELQIVGQAAIRHRMIAFSEVIH